MKQWLFGIAVVLAGVLYGGEGSGMGNIPIIKDIREFGAVGDGNANDTGAIQKALDGGGVIVVPAGKYLTGTLYLESGTDLRMEPGAELLASTDPDCYNTVDFSPKNTNPSAVEHVSARHLLIAIGKKNISISGGRINGNAGGWMRLRPVRRGEDFFANLNPERPAQMLFFRECEEIRMEGVTLVDATYWHLFLHGCRNVRLDGINIVGNHHFLNGDGIDIDACGDVIVRNCIIDTSDDAITLRASGSKLDEPPVCENVIVSGCVLRSGFANAIRIGVGSGTIRNCLIDNVIIRDSATAISFISRYSGKAAGCVIENISIGNLISEAGRFLALKTVLNERVPPPERPGSLIRNIRFFNISGKAERSSWIFGTPENYVENICFSGISFVYSGGGPAPDVDRNGFWGRGSSDAVFDLRYAGNVWFDNVRVLRPEESGGWKYETALRKCRDVFFDGCSGNGGKSWQVFRGIDVVSQ
jgi:hypothetical protein